jgi:hypothetical protein
MDLLGEEIILIADLEAEGVGASEGLAEAILEEVELEGVGRLFTKLSIEF